MMMAKSKRRTLEDRLSELPDSLILHIFEFLPTIDVVRTTVLSHRWKNLWTTTCCLTFDDSMFDDIDKNIGFVDRVIEFWRGNKVFRFSVDLKRKKSSFSHIDSWVRFAVEFGVEELDLHFRFAFQKDEEAYMVPDFLYSCSSLKHLSTRGCNFEDCGSVRWDRLKSLTIVDVCLDEDVISQILLGSPELEVCILSVGESDNSLSICSSSLKELTFERFVVSFTNQLDSEVRIWTPNLEKIRMWGHPYGRYLLENVQSLTRATIGITGPSHHEYGSCPWNDFLGERLREIFSAIQHVEKITLSDWCIEVLGAAAGTSLLSPNPGVKTLKLQGCLEEYEQILGLLETFPKLTRLILEAEADHQPIRADEAESFSDLEFQTDSFLLQLRTIEVSWIKGDTSFYPLMEALLKCASQLEKVVFRKELNRTTCDMELSSFRIAGTADELTEILTKMRS